MDHSTIIFGLVSLILRSHQFFVQPNARTLNKIVTKIISRRWNTGRPCSAILGFKGLQCWVMDLLCRTSGFLGHSHHYHRTVPPGVVLICQPGRICFNCTSLKSTSLSSTTQINMYGRNHSQHHAGYGGHRPSYQASPTPGGYGHPQGAPAWRGPPQPPPGADPQLWQWFSAVDADKSGAITAHELQSALLNGMLVNMRN